MTQAAGARELLLLRHGKSDWREPVADYDRPLKKRGKLGAQRIGAWLQEQALEPDQILASPAERALATAEKCVKAMGHTVAEVETDRQLYMASVEDLLAVLAKTPDSTERLLLVGHNPGLEQLVRALPAQPPATPEDGKLMPTATLAQLRFQGAWSELAPGTAELQRIVRARALSSEFPFPHGQAVDEWRQRPAYYYRQSAVIPFRCLDGQLEILLIGSSSGRHLSVPKGIVEPGLSDIASACREAEQEAGIRGQVQLPALGQYRQAKWGSWCEVTVYALEVTEQLPEPEWQERQRGRQWLSPVRASQQVRQPELGRFITKLTRLLN